MTAAQWAEWVKVNRSLPALAPEVAFRWGVLQLQACERTSMRRWRM